MKTIILAFIAALALPAMAQPAQNSVSTATQVAASPGSIWSINVVGLKGEPLGTVKLEFLNENVRTCMEGKWKRARLVESSFPSIAKLFGTKDDFPTYEENGQNLRIQLNPPGLCDAYLFLHGRFTEQGGKGDYLALGLGGAKFLGAFTAKRQR